MNLKRYRHIVAIALALAVVALYHGLDFSDSQKKADATDAALHFLDLVDSEKYALSWDEAAGFLKEKISREDWIREVAKVRTVYGPLVERKLNDSDYTTEAPGAPEGEYVVLVFGSTFPARDRATETVTVVFDSDDSWRVAGYYIQ